jgi:hypothetical protein
MARPVKLYNHRKADIGLTPAAGSRPQLRPPSCFETHQLRSLATI